MDNEIVLVPVGPEASNIKGVLKVNKESKEILDMLKDDVNEDMIVNILENKYENNHDTLANYVSETLKILRDLHLVIE